MLVKVFKTVVRTWKAVLHQLKYWAQLPPRFWCL